MSRLPTFPALTCRTWAGGPDLLRVLEADAALTANASSKEGISEMAILFRLLDAYRVTQYVSCNLARLQNHVAESSLISCVADLF